MIGNALKSVYKYIGLCMIGTLICTAYTSSAYARICFLPGNNCIDETPGAGVVPTPGGYSDDSEPTPGPEPRESCTIAVEPENEICQKCANGYFKNCECASGFERSRSGNCIPTCKGGSIRQSDGECKCPQGTSMCDDTCMPNTKTGNLILACPNYVCQNGYERVTGLEGCFLKCNAAAGEVHNTTTGKCDCPAGQEHVAQAGDICKPVCPANQSRDSQGNCVPGPNCKMPKILVNESCIDCSDYVLKDRFCDASSDAYSDSNSDGYSEGVTNENCNTKSSNRDLPSDVRANGGSCSKCHDNVNLWKCNVNGQDVRNYADLCYAMGYRYKTSKALCSSPFMEITTDDVKDYGRAVSFVKSQLRAWGLSNSNIFNGDSCSACPFNSSYLKCEGRCNQFDVTHGDAVWMENEGKYTCLECPMDVLVEGAGSTMNMYYCHRNDCPDGTVYDANEDECVNQTCEDKGFDVLAPIDLCQSGTCGLPSIGSVIGSISDSTSGGTAKCQAVPAAKYTARQANKLINAGYVCNESAICKSLYICEPAKALATAVRENGGTCSDCGSNPTKYQCTIGGKNIKQPVDLCNYLGYTLSYADYQQYFAPDPHVTNCQEMACGVGATQYGVPAAGGFFTGRYKCRCASGYSYSNTGCKKACNPICGYSDSCSTGDGYSACEAPAPIPEPEDPEQRCYREGYTMFANDRAFECGYYLTSSCAKCPYTNDPAMYKCSAGDKNETCDIGTECWCCMYPDSEYCGNTPPPPNCDDYSETSYSNMDSGYMDECGQINRNRCRQDGYSDVTVEVLNQAEGCVACPYPHSGNTLYKNCYVPNAEELCRRGGYTTDLHIWESALRKGEAFCDRCPQDALNWGKSCSYVCDDLGYRRTRPSCPSGQKTEEVRISQVTCFKDCFSDAICDEIPTPPDPNIDPEPDPTPNSCVIRGFYKASGEELQKMAEGIYQCNLCPMDATYINGCNDLSAQCIAAGYTIANIRGAVGSKIAEGYTCTQCPYSSAFWMCIEPIVDPCADYSTVACDLTTHQCTESISECGCLKCDEPGGTVCTKDKECSQALNQWGRCEGTCNCTGVKCGNGETCKQTNACGNCVAGQCECPGTKCTTNQICNGSMNACGNCKDQCLDKGCPEGYVPNYPGGCPDTAQAIGSEDICYGKAKPCVCPSGKYEHCTSDQIAYNEETVGDIKCYSCSDKTCADYGYQTNTSCSSGYKAVTQTPRTGLTCYVCKNDTCPDGYTKSNTGCSTTQTEAGTTCYKASCGSGSGSTGGYPEDPWNPNKPWNPNDPWNPGSSNGNDNNNNNNNNDCLYGEKNCNGSDSASELTCAWEAQRNCTDCNGRTKWYCDDSYSDAGSDEISEGISEGYSDGCGNCGAGQHCSEGHCCDEGYEWGTSRCVAIDIGGECTKDSDCKCTGADAGKSPHCYATICACM